MEELRASLKKIKWDAHIITFYAQNSGQRVKKLPARQET